MNRWKGLLFWECSWRYLIVDTGLPAGNSYSLNLTSLKDDDDSLVRSLSWGVRSDKPSLVRASGSELLPTKFLWSSLISFSSDFWSSWDPKFSNKLSSSYDIGISCLSGISMKRTCWLVHVFMCLMSPCVDFILFLYPGQL